MDMVDSRSSARLSPLPLVRVVITVDRCCRVGQGGRWERGSCADAGCGVVVGRPTVPTADRRPGETLFTVLLCFTPRVAVTRVYISSGE